MPSIDPQALKELLSFHALFPIDKVVHENIEVPIQHVVAAATLSGGIYMPKTSILTIANPIGKKAFINMMWSIDGTNYYVQKPLLYQPGNPIPDGKVGATVGCSISDTEIKFYFTHYIGSAVTFRIKYVLDNIL